MTEKSAGEQRISQAWWRSVAVLGALVAIVVGARLWNSVNQTNVETLVDFVAPGPQVPRAILTGPPVIRFTDISLESGIDFVHEAGADGERLLPETMGGGVAFLDLDNDGDQDLFLVNSNYWPWQTKDTSRPTSRLYRNRGDGSFEDISVASGMDLTLYGMGVATGDYDGDGWIDVFVTALGQNRLLRNIGGERFVDVTEVTGVGGDGEAWSTSAAFFDYDQDGDLDLFVCNYVAWSPDIDREVDYRLAGVGRAYGPPTDFAGSNSYLYRNDGGQFSDVSEQAGINIVQGPERQAVGKALAVRPVDVNNDGWLDIAVANDTVRNFLFLNEKNGHFREIGVASGFSYDSGGMATGAMGIDASYVNNDEKLAIAIGNFSNEMSSFYVRRSEELVFSDDAIVAGIGADSRRALTFGLMFLDLDLDGRVDLLTANGHVEPEINRVQSSQQYAQRLQWYWNCGPSCRRMFTLAKNTAGDFNNPLIGRGAAYADIDSDGDLDLAITTTGGRAVLLQNNQDLGNHWIRIQLRAESTGGHVVGASVSVVTDDVTQRRSAVTARSYLSQVEAPLTFGLGDADVILETIVVWPDGETESWTDLAADTTHILQQGTGTRR